MNDEHPHSRRGFFRCASLAGSLLSGVAARGQTQRPRYDLLVRGGRAGRQATNTSAESKSTRRLATTRPSGSATSSKRTYGQRSTVFDGSPKAAHESYEEWTGLSEPPPSPHTSPPAAPDETAAPPPSRPRPRSAESTRLLARGAVTLVGYPQSYRSVV